MPASQTPTRTVVTKEFSWPKGPALFQEEDTDVCLYKEGRARIQQMQRGLWVHEAWIQTQTPPMSGFKPKL